MRVLLRTLTASAVLMMTNVHGSELLVGTYTEGASEGIYRYRFSTQGELDTRPLQVIPGTNPSWLTFSEDHRQVFVVNEQGKGQVASFSLEQLNRLSPLNQVGSGGGEPTYSSLSYDRRFLFVANYGGSAPEGGNLSVLPVSVDGRLGEVVQQFRHSPSKVDGERQASAHVHSVVASPDGSYVFVADLGADRIFRYRYQGSSVTQPLSLVDSVALPPGSGPRHLLFDESGTHAWVTLEMSGEVALLNYRDGALKLGSVMPLTDSSDPADKAAGALHASADGRFLYVSNRGNANELVVFSIDQASGELTFVQRRSVEGEHPREFALAPEQNFVLVGNQKSNEIVVIRRDPQSGLLGETVQVVSQASPSDIKFID